MPGSACRINRNEEIRFRVLTRGIWVCVGMGDADRQIGMVEKAKAPASRASRAARDGQD